MDDLFPGKNDELPVDNLAPESGPGEGTAGFSAKAQQREFLGGGGPKSEWPMGVKKSVEVNGKNWEYLEYGNPDGQPILNIHGWLGASAEGNEKVSRALAGEFQDSIAMQNLVETQIQEDGTEKTIDRSKKIREITEELKGKYRIVTPQLPGFGRSENLENPTLDHMVDELASFQKQVGIDSSVVFGSSMGGILGIKLAARYPEQVKALILQGTMTQPKDMKTLYYWMGKFATLPLIKQGLEIIPGAGKFAKDAIFKPGIKKSMDFKLAGDEGRVMILNDVDNAQTQTVLSTLAGIGSHLVKEMENISAPVAVLDGVNGELVPIATTKKIADRFHLDTVQTEKYGDNSLGQKIADRKVMYFQIGGVAGEHGHAVVNTAPEMVAIFINRAVDYFNK